MQADQAADTLSATSLVPSDPSWQPILHGFNQVVLYNPTSHALTVYPSNFPSDPHSPSLKPQGRRRLCPYCSQPLPNEDHSDDDGDYDDLDRFEDVSPDARAANYFQLLEVANETASTPATPPNIKSMSAASSRASSPPASPAPENGRAFRPQSMAEGYFQAFFQEEVRLGMGANGSVYLCQHVLNGNPLGHFAVKKIAVGQSSSYLLQILREVRLLETLRHPNIITYHHAWLETAQFSSFGPKIPTLHVLMQWADGGSLDDYIDARLGRETNLPHPESHHDDEVATSTDPEAPSHSRSARIRAFRALQRATPEQKSAVRAKYGFDSRSGTGGSWKAVHLLSAEEVRSLFGGVVAGLGFLHDKSILHLDLKPGNVLLTWDEGNLIPRAMLSDFGTSRDMLHSSGVRTGNTGTLEYTAPESLPKPPSHTLPPTDSKADMWSLGMILHKLLFFRLPYRWAARGDRAAPGGSRESSDDGNDMERLEREVSMYPGFKASPGMDTVFTSRHLPRAYIYLLESLLNITATSRPSCEKVLAAIQLGKLEPISSPSNRTNKHIPSTSVMPASLIPAPRRPQSSSPPPTAQLTDIKSPSTSTTTLSRYSPPAAQPLPIDDPDLTPRSEPAEPRWTKLKEEDTRVSAALPLPAPEQPFSFWAHVLSDRNKSRTLRLVKSSVLVMKVVSIMSHHSRPGSWTVSVLVYLGVQDTLSDSILLSLFLGLLHVLILYAVGAWGLRI
ncbi:kinase-like protein [Auriscalpium vulgare]|uniref:Kinase-like protein n=1 Tax=Auriscalpium vulgare TaxID=40419 RepID=A0ACB8RF22_9AGAM|nr:kinase-like protein [Auriscalpium vulgare]